MKGTLKAGLVLGSGAVLAVFLLLLVSPVFNPPKWDEFIVVFDAHRLVAGQVPYGDFFNIIPPGAFFLLGALFKVLGASTLTAGRYASLVVVMATTLAAGLLLRRRGWSVAAGSGWALVMGLCLYPYWAVPSHHWFAAACDIFFLFMLADRKPTSFRRWGTAGFFAGMGGLFYQGSGLLLVALSLVFLLLEPGAKGRRWASWGAGFSAVWLPVTAYLGAKGALVPFIRDVILWPLRNYSRPGNENATFPLWDLPGRLAGLGSRLGGGPDAGKWITLVAGGWLYGIILTFAVATLALACFYLVRSIKRKSFDGPWIPAAVLAVFLEAGLWLKGGGNWLHLVYLLGPLGLLWLSALGNWARWSLPMRRAGLIALGTLLAAGILYHGRGLWVHVPRPWELSEVDRVTREQAVNRFLHVPGVMGRFDSVAAFPEGGEVYLYGIRPAVGYTYFTPLSANYNTLGDHEAVARQISERRPKWILMTPGLEDGYLDKASPVAGVIRDRYERMGVVGNAVVYGGGTEKALFEEALQEAEGG